MYKLFDISDFEMHLNNQALNSKFLQNNLKKKDCLRHPLLKMEADIRLQSKENSFLKNQLEPNHIKPP